MAVLNVKLRVLREAVVSTSRPGEPLGRSELAEAVNDYLWRARNERYELDGHSIARYERGQVLWPSEPYRAALRAVLGVATDAELGFRPTRRGRTKIPSGQVISLAEYGTTTDLGVSPAEFLSRMTVETPVPTRIGWTDVDHVRATTRAVAAAENLFGGGLSCEAATSQLRWAGKLVETRASDDVRSAMFEAVGNLSGVVAYSAFDIADYTTADRCFQFALWCADQGDSWRLRANTLAEMARKATYLGKIDEALTLIEFAQVRADRISATARAMLSTVRARLLSVAGRYIDAETEVDRADTYFGDRDLSADPPWMIYYDEAEHEGSAGKALIPVATDRRQPELAAPRLERAIRLHADSYPRSRAFSRTRLASLAMAVGDPHEAVVHGRRAVADAASLRSARILSELRDLARNSERHVGIGEVAELRQEIAVLVRPSS